MTRAKRNIRRIVFASVCLIALLFAGYTWGEQLMQLIGSQCSVRGGQPASSLQSQQRLTEREAAQSKNATWSLMQSAVASRTTANHREKNASKEKIFLIPSDDVLCNMSERERLQLYWRYINTLQVLCRNTMRHGVLTDGGKEVCIDEQFGPKRPCLVYSFGVNSGYTYPYGQTVQTLIRQLLQKLSVLGLHFLQDTKKDVCMRSELRFDFEYSILRAYGCEIHTFDPSIKIDARNKKEIPNGVTYHEIGLDKADYVNNQGWKMQTLPSVVHSLQHDKRVIDIMKIDVEGGEWSGFQNISHFQPLDNVKQLCIELHFGRLDPNKGGGGYWGNTHPADQLRVLRMLYDKGFRIFMREHMMWRETQSDAVYGPQLTIINEISLINLRWKARREMQGNYNNLKDRARNFVNKLNTVNLG